MKEISIVETAKPSALKDNAKAVLGTYSAYTVSKSKKDLRKALFIISKFLLKPSIVTQGIDTPNIVINYPLTIFSYILQEHALHLEGIILA